MINFIRINFFIFLLISGPSLAGGYVLGVGDEISISVYQEEDLSFSEIMIPKGGVIAYPFIGNIKVEGKTIEVLKREIYSSLKGDYLINPKVSVSILNYRGFFVDGQVKLPGKYPYEPGLTARKAISISGGFTDRAATDFISIIKEGRGNDGAKKTTLDVSISPGDVIIVNESFF